MTVVELSDRLIGREDEDVSLAIAEIMKNEGIAVRTHAGMHQPRAACGGR